MRYVILMGLLVATAFPNLAGAKDRNKPADMPAAPPLCSAEMRLAIDATKAQKSRADFALPVPVFAPEAEFPDSARKQARKQHGLWADSIVGFTVDAEGNPRNVCMIEAAGLDLDVSAVNAAKRYKFKPAMDHGNPIAYPTSMSVSFRLF